MDTYYLRNEHSEYITFINNQEQRNLLSYFKMWIFAERRIYIDDGKYHKYHKQRILRAVIYLNISHLCVI